MTPTTTTTTIMMMVGRFAPGILPGPRMMI
jgi:hypothetical protein